MTRIGLRCLASGLAIAAIVARYVFGVQIDGIAVGLLWLVFLPWLAPLIKSVEIPGIGKIELQEIKEKVEEAKGAAQSASQKAELALAGAAVESGGEHRGALTEDDATSRLEECASEYNRLRKTLPSGATRTALMLKVVSKMIKNAPLLTNYDVEGALKQPDGGKRLSAYAFLYARPDWKFLGALVSSVVEIEDKRFGQYWGILAIQRVVDSQVDQPVPGAVTAKLSAFLRKLEPGTDRHYELKKLIEQIGRK